MLNRLTLASEKRTKRDKDKQRDIKKWTKRTKLLTQRYTHNIYFYYKYNNLSESECIKHGLTLMSARFLDALG